MSQLGSGNGSSFRAGQINTRQVYRNSAASTPDSDTRLDAEFANDVLAALEDHEYVIGANAQGTFGSIAARLNQFLPGGGIAPANIPFTNATSVTIPGTVHRLGTSTILFQVYDNGIPAAAISPGSFTVLINPATYDVTITFAGQQSGSVVLTAAAPLYTATFTNTNNISVPGTTHLLGTQALFYAFYSTANPVEIIEPATFTVAPGPSFNVTATFASNQTGSLVLSAFGPRYVKTLTGQSQYQIDNAEHLLGTASLLYQVYDAGNPASPIEPQSFTVDPNTYRVIVTFGAVQNGTLVLGASQGSTGSDFAIQDAGIANTSAVRINSTSGNLNLQAGGGNHIYLRNRLGTIVGDMDDTGRLGLGMQNPTFQLQLPVDSAAKPGTSAWTVASDARLKEVLRPFEDGLAVLQALNPLWYIYNGLGGMPRDKQEQVGVLAQEVQPLAPYLINSYRGRLTSQEPETDILTFNAHAMPFMLVNAVKELAARLLLVEEECRQLREALTNTPPQQE